MLVWASIGYIAGGDGLPEAFSLMPAITLGAAIFFVIWLLYFQGNLLPNNEFRQKRILDAFKQAKLKHYLLFLILRSPALLAAVIVYSVALNLFGVDASFIELLPYLPVIFFAAAVPLHACRRDYILGNIISGKRRANGRFWIRTA